MRWDSVDAEPIAIAPIRSRNDVIGSFPTRELVPAIGISPNGDESYYAGDKSFGFCILKTGKIINGNHSKISDSARAPENDKEHNSRNTFLSVISSNAAIATLGKDSDSASRLADVLSTKKSEDANASSTYFAETCFRKTGLDRRTTSDFGLIGSIIAQLGGEE